MTSMGSAKWQADGWPWPRSTSSGSCSAQISCAFQHLVRNRHPDGGDDALGTSPVSRIRLRCRSTMGSGTGTADAELTAPWHNGKSAHLGGPVQNQPPD